MMNGVRIAVLGLGLIGGSLLRAAAARGHEVTGFDVSAETRAAAREAGYAVADEVAGAVEDAGVAVLAVPLPAIPSVLSQLAGFRGLITDVTSVKVPVDDLLGGERFVGGHPMAGKETSGFAASDAALFEGCAWVLCLEDETRLDDWLTLATLCTGLGARVVPATAVEHDAAVARVSHVPHLLAAALSGLLDGNPLAGTLAAGSFRDGSRVAATRPELIAAMCGGNAGPVGAALDEVIAQLAAYRKKLGSIEEVAAAVSGPHRLRRAWAGRELAGVTVRAERRELLELGRAGGWVTRVGSGQELTAMAPSLIP